MAVPARLHRKGQHDEQQYRQRVLAKHHPSDAADAGPVLWMARRVGVKSAGGLRDYSGPTARPLVGYPQLWLRVVAVLYGPRRPTALHGASRILPA
jgi:hypothetical protein